MNHSLKPWNTFGIDHNAQHIVCAEDEQQLLNAWQHATAEGQPVLILGEGSNVLFLEDYRGTVIINRIKGIEIHDADSDRVVRDYCSLFGNASGRTGRCEIFSGTECEEFFLDDCGCGDGTDVLFPVDCYGNFDHVWILYEKGRID